MKRETVDLSFRGVPSGLWVDVKVLAAQDGKTLRQVLIDALRAYLIEQSKKGKRHNGPTDWG